MQLSTALSLVNSINVTESQYRAEILFPAIVSEGLKNNGIATIRKLTMGSMVLAVIGMAFFASCSM